MTPGQKRRRFVSSALPSAKAIHCFHPVVDHSCALCVDRYDSTATITSDFITALCTVQDFTLPEGCSSFSPSVIDAIA
jgi:hypothetical protein